MGFARGSTHPTSHEVHLQIMDSMSGGGRMDVLQPFV